MSSLLNTPPAPLATEEIEVFRLTPEKGKHYETVLLTRKEGCYPDTKYYTNKKPYYVGVFDRQIVSGYGDGKQVADIFEGIDGQPTEVWYTYEGTTAYREVIID